jgi:hypothetical protein
METKQESGGNHWNRLPRWARWVFGIIGAILLLGIGGAIGSSNEGDLKSEISNLEARLASAHDERDQAVKKTEQIEGLKAKIIGKANRKADSILSGAKAESEEAKGELGNLHSEIASAEEQLSSVEGSLNGAREKKAKSTIPGSGTFKAEVDYIPGTYESAGGPTCYWATLNSADPFDIESNENAHGQTIASIHSPYFQTKSCGTWKRIGE